MNIDQKIQQELKNEASKIDDLLENDQGLFAMFGNVLKGRLRGWAIIANVVVLIVTGLFIWCGYEFFTANDLDARIFWGVWFIIGIFSQSMLKLWLFMQMDRYSLLREIKRQERAIERLESSLIKTA